MESNLKLTALIEVVKQNEIENPPVTVLDSLIAL